MTMTVDGFVIGDCLEGTEIGIVDYSRKDRSPTGEITLIERGYADAIRYEVRIETFRAAQIRDTLASKRATTARYIGTSSQSITDVTGYLNNFVITLGNGLYSSCTINVESTIHH